MAFLLFEIHQVSGICKFIPFTKLWKFSAISFSNILFCTIFFFFFWDLNEININLLVLSLRSLRPCSGFQTFFSLLLRLDDSISLSLSSLTCLCHMHSATENIQWVVQFSHCIFLVLRILFGLLYIFFFFAETYLLPFHSFIMCWKFLL